MKTKLIFLSLLFLNLSSIFSQQDSITPKRDAYVIGFLPSQRVNIYGLSLGLIGSEVFCNLMHKRNSHGLNLQLFGNGGFVILTKHFWNQKGFAEDTVFQRIFLESQNYKIRHNGIIVSAFGTNTSVTNGIAISGLVSNGTVINGIGLNLLSNNYLKSNGVFISIFNQSYQTNGIQIGLVNRSKHIKGLQIGLWNVNSKRKLPLINWGF